MHIKRLALALFIALSVILPAGVVMPSLPTAPESALASEPGCSHATYQPFLSGGWFWGAHDYSCGSDWGYRQMQVCLQLQSNMATYHCVYNSHNSNGGYQQTNPGASNPPGCGGNIRTWAWMAWENGTTNVYVSSWVCA